MGIKCDNIFLAAVEGDAQEAADLQMRSDLLTVLTSIVREHDWSQGEAAKQLGMTQPQVSLVMNRKINDLTTQRLLKALHHLGFSFRPKYDGGEVSVQVKQAKILTD